MAMLVRHDTRKTFLLVAISLVTLPLSLLLCSLSYIVSKFRDDQNGEALRRRRRAMPDFRERTVLVTGVGTAKGLTLARAFYLSGHRVIGADFENSRVYTCSGRYSRAISNFVRLSKPKAMTTAREKTAQGSGEQEYIDALLRIIRDYDVDLWVPCSGVAGAIEDARAREAVELLTRCQCVQLGPAATATLLAKDSFTREASRLGLPMPETYVVLSHDAALRLLLSSKGPARRRRYVLKPVGVGDAHRGDMTLLPIPPAGGGVAATKAYVTSLPISDATPWILQQFIPGGREYRTHALVVEGQVRACTACRSACRSAELLMHYEPLTSAEEPVARAMLAFTQEFAGNKRRRAAGDSLARERMTGHLSFDFMVEEGESGDSSGGGGEKADGVKLYAIECNPRVRTAVVCMAQPDTMEEMVDAYLSVLSTPTSGSPAPKDQNSGKGKKSASSQGSSAKGHDRPSPSSASEGRPDPAHIVMPGPDALPRYWIGHDLVVLGLLPLMRLLTADVGLAEFVSSLNKLIRHILFWKEGTFEAWDPLPFLALYHLYWPVAILEAWWQGRRWSRINVSTTKMFYVPEGR